MTIYRHVRASTDGLKMNDVIEDWRHWRRSVARSPWSVERRIFQWLSMAQWKCQLMH